MPVLDNPLSLELQQQILELVDSRVPSSLHPAFAEFLEKGTSRFRHPPVPVDEFIASADYLNKPATVYPVVMDELRRINSGNFYEVLATGSIGSAKTFVAVVSTAYQLYLLSCFRDPHHEFGLDPASEILFVIQSTTERLAKGNAFETLRTLLSTSPYFRSEFPFETRVKSRLVFPRRIEVWPVSGDSAAVIGQNVIGGILDEVNFMEVVDKSRRSRDGRKFDQAEELYTAISRRRKSRFLRNGAMPGILFLVSSRRYRGQFTDRVELRAKTDPGVYVYDRRVWEIKPDAFSGETFRVFTGDSARNPRIIVADEGPAYADPDLVIEVPVEFRADFENDIVRALQDIGGVSAEAVSPLFTSRDKVAACFGRRSSVLSRTCVEFSSQAIEANPDRFGDARLPRFVHVDLAVTGDSAGIACGHVPRFERISRGSLSERLPVVHLDFSLRVVPPPGREISFERIRELLYGLRDLGLPIRWITFDAFQSVDSRQLLGQKGFDVGLRSIDRDTTAYDFLKGCISDGRLEAPRDDHLVGELLGLELDRVKGKVDHRPGASKDVADALAGVVYGLTVLRAVWVQHGIPLREVPDHIRQALRDSRVSPQTHNL